MKLTPLDIRHKEFKRGMRGYADVEVDEFLDEVADEYERLFKENIDLQDRVEALEEKVAGYQRIEETLQKTLVNAQASAEEQKQNANKQAQLILQDAELKSRQMVNEAYSERQAIEQSMAKLKSGEEDFRFKFRQLLEGYLRQLGEVPEAVEAAPAPDFARQAEAIKEAIARESTLERAAAPASAPTPQRTAAPASAPTPQRTAAPASAPTPQRTAAPASAPMPERAAAPASAPPPAPERDEPEASEPVAPPLPAPGGGPVTPSRGPGGIQAGTPHREPATAPEDDARPEAETTMSQPAKTPEADEGQPASRERISFGESEDLLADVDTEVNENEFKW